MSSWNDPKVLAALPQFTTTLPIRFGNDVSNNLDSPHCETEYYCPSFNRHPTIRFSNLAKKPFNRTPEPMDDNDVSSSGPNRPSSINSNNSSSTVSSTKSSIFDTSDPSSSPHTPLESPSPKDIEVQDNFQSPSREAQRNLEKRRLVKRISYIQELENRDASSFARHTASPANIPTLQSSEAEFRSEQATPSPAAPTAEWSQSQVLRASRLETKYAETPPRFRLIDTPDTKLDQLPSRSGQEDATLEKRGTAEDSLPPHGSQLSEESDVKVTILTETQISGTLNHADDTSDILPALETVIQDDSEGYSSEPEENLESTPAMPTVVCLPPEPVQPELNGPSQSTQGNEESASNSEPVLKTPPFMDYNSKLVSPKEINQMLLSAVEGEKRKKNSTRWWSSKTPKIDLDSYYIYIYKIDYSPNKEPYSGQSYVKIGRTKTTPRKRRDGWSRQCLLPIEPVDDPLQKNFRHGSLAEKLIQMELTNERRKYSCERCRKMDGSTPQEHEEWFEIDEAKALEVVQKWEVFFIERKPYNKKRVLRPFWRKRYERLSETLSDPDCWTQFFRRPTTWEIIWHLICYGYTEAGEVCNQVCHCCMTVMDLLVELFGLWQWIFASMIILLLYQNEGFIWAFRFALVITPFLLMKDAW